MYLEPIFSLDDIMDALPVESRKFANTNAFYKASMKSMAATPQVHKIAVKDAFLAALQKNNTDIDQIFKGLNYYLDLKRQSFPRFYFLSNEEMIEIFGRQKDHHEYLIVVNSKINKMFSGISKVQSNREESKIVSVCD